MPLPENYKEQILKKLKEKGATPNCELCSHNDWSVIDQAISAPISDLTGNLRISQPQVPCAGLICNNCGNLRLFALGALGIDINKK